MTSATTSADAAPFFRVGEAESDVIRDGVAYWESLRAGRKFPARADVTLRGLGRLAKYIILVRVIDDGKDYEYRFVGNVPVTAVGVNFQGRRMNEPAVAAVMQANYRQALFGLVVKTGEPWLFKCSKVDYRGLDLPVRSETAYLPLGLSDGAVDHLLGFTVFSCADHI